jgi:mannitol 2-dehydrogenase
MAFFEKADETVYHWARANVTFPSTMVDRITPATTEEDIAKLEKYTGKATGFRFSVRILCSGYRRTISLPVVLPGSE